LISLCILRTLCFQPHLPPDLGEYSSAKTAMRVIYCVTLSFFLISCASQRTPTSSASPLPPPTVHRRELLDSGPQGPLISKDASYCECGRPPASIASVNSELLNRHRPPAVCDRISAGPNQVISALKSEEYPYPTTTKTPKRCRTKSSLHSSTQVEALGSTSITPGTCELPSLNSSTCSDIPLIQYLLPPPVPLHHPSQFHMARFLPIGLSTRLGYHRW